MLDHFTWIVILLPLAVYFIVIGIYSSRRRPLLVSGTRDLIALGMGLVGVMMVGPFTLFFPQATFNFLGGRVWFGLAMLYMLLLSLIALSQRPRIVGYSMKNTNLKGILHHLVSQLDPDATWAGNAFNCPNLQISGVVEQHAFQSTAQIVANSRQQSLAGWIQIHSELEQLIKQQPKSRISLSPWLAVGLAVALVVLSIVTLAPDQTVASMQEMLRY